MPRSYKDHPALEFMREIDRLPVSEAARAEFKRLIRRHAGQRIVFARAVVERPTRVQLARKLLDGGMSVAEVRTALVERIQIKPRAAYMLIGDALDITPNTPSKEPQ